MESNEYVPGWCPYCGEPEAVCDSRGGCRDDDYEDEDPFESFDCHKDRHGNCGLAGSEECEFDCPFNR